MNTRMICETCGGELELSSDRLSGKCPFCRNTYYFKEEKSEALVLALNRAVGHRLACDFHEAIKEYKLVLDKAPTDAEAHFGMMLATYGIEYVRDRRTNRYIPTCHRFVDKDILENKNYLAAIENATAEQRVRYEQQASDIASLQKGIRAKLDSEEPYDVFISFKATDDNGIGTEDAIIARNVYDALTKKGIKAFFSEVSLRNRIGDEYEPIIYRALYSCKFFILVATKEEHINAPWVKNEWTRFEDRISDEGLSGACTCVFNGINPYNLPRAFQAQGVDLEKHPFDYAITVADSLEKKLLTLGKDTNKGKNGKRDGNTNKATEEQASPEVKPQQKTGLTMEEFLSICVVEGSAVTECRDKSISSLDIPNGITAIGYQAFQGCGKLNSITIPDSVVSIADEAFHYCPNLTSVTIPDSVVSIGNSAFYGCTSLASITIPSSVKSIGSCAFGECKSLTSVAIPNSVVSIGVSAFYNCISLKSVTIPDSVKSIGVRAFFGCASLASVSVPSSVKSISEEAFNGCKSLASVTIPSSVVNIGELAFAGCASLKSVAIPDSVKGISRYAFYGCTSLASVTIPRSVKSIGDSAFYGCISLSHIFYKGHSGKLKKLVKNAFYESGSKAELTYDGAEICYVYSGASLSAKIYSYSKIKPIFNKYCWHYDEDGNIVLW